MEIRASLIIALLAGSFVFLEGCGSQSSTVVYSDGSGSEVAISTVAGIDYSIQGLMAFRQGGPNLKKSILAELKDGLFLFSPSWGADCSTVIPTNASFCESGILPYKLSDVGTTGCTTSGGAVTWAGRLNFTWTTGTCNAPPINSVAGSVFTRTTDPTTSGVSRTQGPYTVTSTTYDNVGYKTAKSGGMTISCTDVNSGSCATTRSINIKGVHHIGSSANLASWNHTVSTDSPISITGVASVKVIVSMGIRVQDNVRLMTSITSNTGPLTHTAGCCFPTGGGVTTSYTGGPFNGKSEVLTFTATCGSAILTPAGGTPQTLTFTHCL